MTSEPLLSAHEANTRATEFLERREFGIWADKDEQELALWLAASKAHCAAFWRLEAAWDRTHRLAALKAERLERPFSADVRETSPWFLSAAAAVVVAVIGVSIGIYASWPSDVVYQTPVGGREIITLADGSQIELNTNTVLETQITKDTRSVRLVRGEAYFHIRHDETRPFVVEASGKRITDIGTVFTVRDDAGSVRVALLEGEARFDAGGKPVVMKPGDKIIATADQLTVSHNSPQTLAADLGWRRGVVIFKRTSLAQVAAEFNRYNETKLVIADPQVAKLTVGGTFPANNVELFGRMASEILGLCVVRRENKIAISR